MGMHFGFIAARCDWGRLQAAIEARYGPLGDMRAISGDEWFDPAGHDVLHVAAADDATYVLDPTMILSADSDLVVAAAQDLACSVVGAGGETVSGTFWLTAADATGLRRLHFELSATVSEPFDIGDPLPSEAAVPWNDIDGAGILARVQDLGLSTALLESGPPGSGLRVAFERVEVPAPGRLGEQINEHCERYERPDADDWTDNIQVVARDRQSADTTGSSRRRARRRWLFKR